MKGLALSAIGFVALVVATLFMIDFTLAGRVGFTDRTAVHWDEEVIWAKEDRERKEALTPKIIETSNEMQAQFNGNSKAEQMLSNIWKEISSDAEGALRGAKRWENNAPNFAKRNRAAVADARKEAEAFYQEHCIFCLHGYGESEKTKANADTGT